MILIVHLETKKKIGNVLVLGAVTADSPTPVKFSNGSFEIILFRLTNICIRAQQ